MYIKKLKRLIPNRTFHTIRIHVFLFQYILFYISSLFFFNLMDKQNITHKLMQLKVYSNKNISSSYLLCTEAQPDA